jgi:EC042_2821-lke REase
LVGWNPKGCTSSSYGRHNGALCIKSKQKSGAIVQAKVSTDASAVSFVPSNAEEIWPHRQKDLIRAVNQQIGRGRRVNSHDIYCIRVVFDILKARPDFAYKSHTLASPQYSDTFIDWIVSEYRKDGTFFQRARVECRKKLESRKKGR